MFNVKNVYILGDFNFHYECDSEPSVKTFKTLIAEHQLEQLVNTPTLKHQHTLDLVLSRGECSTISGVTVNDICLSDHHTITFELDVTKPKPEKQVTKTRNIKNINTVLFKEDVIQSLSSNPPSSFDSLNTCLTEMLNTCLTEVLDKHAPIRTRVVTARPGAPSLTLEVKAAKQNKRKAERR